MYYRAKDGSARVEVMTRDAANVIYKEKGSMLGMRVDQFDALYEVEPPAITKAPEDPNPLPKWRGKQDPSVIVELVTRDAANVTYKQNGSMLGMPVDQFDKTYEPVLPTVRFVSPSQPVSSPSRALPDGTIIPATLEMVPTPNPMMTAVGSLLDEVRLLRGEVLQMRDQVSAMHAIVVPAATPTKPDNG